MAIEDTAIAELLMNDYGVSNLLTNDVTRLVQKARKKGLIHCLIASSVRGWSPHPITSNLKEFLEKHKTRPPTNHKRVEKVGGEAKDDRKVGTTQSVLMPEVWEPVRRSCWTQSK